MCVLNLSMPKKRDLKSSGLPPSQALALSSVFQDTSLFINAAVVPGQVMKSSVPGNKFIRQIALQIHRYMKALSRQNQHKFDTMVLATKSYTINPGERGGFISSFFYWFLLYHLISPLQRVQECRVMKLIY